MNENDQLRELAEAAKDKIDGPLDFEALVERAIRNYGNLILFNERLYSLDYESICRRYAEQLGKSELTSFEKQQAVFDAILKQADGDG